jgi:ribonuclease HII
MSPGVEYEQALLAAGHRFIAGLDEAGRGCWAGPVVAAAVVLAPHTLATPHTLAGVDDSKALTAHQRDAAYERIAGVAESVGVGIVPAYLIDAYGIVPATRLAMTVALLALAVPVEALLIDALRLDIPSLPQQALIRGDAQSLSIAAASIVAKVTRDRLMHTADRAWPGYGFAAHKGYGTAAHQHALRSLGVCPFHRRTFRPVARVVWGAG